MTSVNASFSCNVGIGCSAPYWYSLDVAGSVRLQDVTITSNFTTNKLSISNAYIKDIYSSNIYTQYIYGDAQYMSNIPTVGLSSLSSIVSYGLSSVYADSANPGVSSLSSIISYGLSSFVTFLYTSNAQIVNSITFGQSNDAAIAEYNDDLFIYKGSNSANRIYIQTPGSFIVETGAQPSEGWSNNVTYGNPVFSVGSNNAILLNGPVTTRSNIFLYDSSGNLNTTFCNTVGSRGFFINQAGTSNSGAIITITDGLAGSIGSGSNAYGAIHIQQNSNGTPPTTTGITIGGYSNNGTMAGIISKSDKSGTDLQLMTTDNFAQGMKNRVTIAANGSVGIGLSNPSTQLEVAGNTVIHGSLQTGSNNLILAIATTNGIQYYTNGQLYSTNFDSNISVREIAYNGSTWVATGINNGNVYTSSDFINWIRPIGSPSGITTYTVIYGSNLWYLAGSYIGQDNFYSYDANVWYQGSQNIDPINKVAFNINTGVYVIVTTASDISCISYFTIINNIFNTKPITSGGFNNEIGGGRGNYIYYNPNNNIWIALGKTPTNNTIQYSRDASNFFNASNITDDNDKFFTSGRDGALSVDYGNGRFIVVGDDNGSGGDKKNMYYSDDGINYNLLTNNISIRTLSDIKYFSGSTWFASDNNESFLYRSDDNGSRWYQIPLSSKPTRLTVANAPVFTNTLLGNTAINKGTTANALDINGTMNIGSSNSGLIVTITGNGTNPIQLYQNSALVNAKIYNTTVTNFTDVSTNGSIYVAAGLSNGLRYSYDGQTYFDGYISGITGPFAESSSNVRIGFGGSNTWIAVSQSSGVTIAFSYDGITWNRNTNSFTNYAFTGLKYNGSYWLFTANGNNNTSNSILYTTNPLGNSNAFLPTLTGGFNRQANAVEWNGLMWVATGSIASNIQNSNNSNIQYSYNGRNWLNANASFGSNGNSIAYGNGAWVVGGLSRTAATSIYTSSNGTNFVAYGGTYTNIIDVKFIQSNSLGGAFYALATSGINPVLITSINGSNWSIVPNSTFSSFTPSRLALGYPYQQLLSVNGATTTNALNVNGATSLVGTTTIGGTFSVNGATTLGGNTYIGGALTVNTLVSPAQRQIRYFTNIITGDPTGGYTLTNGIYTNTIIDNNYITGQSNFSSTEWILTIAGYRVFPNTTAFSNISGVYCAPNNLLWNYYITGQPGYKLSNITMQFIAYPANFILNTGTTQLTA